MGQLIEERRYSLLMSTCPITASFKVKLNIIQNTCCFTFQPQWHSLALISYPLQQLMIFVLCCDARDMASLARAAVDGDAAALDMFMWSKDTAAAKSVKLSSALYKSEARTFYVASNDGKMHITYLRGLVSMVCWKFLFIIRGKKAAQNSICIDDDDDDVQWFNVHLKADWKPA